MFLTFAFMNLNSEILSEPQYPVSFASHYQITIVISNLNLKLIDKAIVYLFTKVIYSILQYKLSNYRLVITVLLKK